MATKIYPCLAYGKKLNLAYKFERYMNMYMSYRVFLLCIQPKQDIPILRKDENFWPHEDEKLILKEENIEDDDRNLQGKSLDT